MKICSIFGNVTCGTGCGLCGTASRALLALLLKHGMNSHEDLQAKTDTYARGQKFLCEFRKRMGANSCEGILGVTLGSPEYVQQFQKLRATRCVDAVRTATQIIDGLM